MPAKSPKQRALFSIAEHHPDKLYAKNKSLVDLPHETLHDFAATHFADGGTMASSSTFQQNESTGNGGDWMERARSIKPPSVASTKMPQATNAKFRSKPPSQVPHLADGKKPDHWAAEAFKPSHRGELHRALNVPEDKKIPAAKMAAAGNSKSSHIRHMVQAAKNI